MIVQCAVIILLLLVMTFIFVRAKRKDWALSVLPLIMVPAGNIFVHFLFRFIIKQPLNIEAVSVANVIAVLVSGVWVGIMSNNYETKSKKLPYICVSMLFNILLAWILISNFLEGIQ